MRRSKLGERTALITGSTQGIGLEIAKAFAGAGARIGVHGLASPGQVDEIVNLLARHGAAEVRFFDADLTSVDAIETMMDAVEAWGGADILVNNAGIQVTGKLTEITPDLWNRIIAINLSAGFHTMRRALPIMAARGYGRVINIASVHGVVGSTNKAPYVAAKHGLVGLSKVASLEYAAAGSAASGGITVNCICPGWTKTPILMPQILERSKALGSDEAHAIADLLSEKQPSLRLSDPSEIGSLALWLCAPIAHNLTGTAIPIDGGWTAQ